MPRSHLPPPPPPPYATTSYFFPVVLSVVVVIISLVAWLYSKLGAMQRKRNEQLAANRKKIVEMEGRWSSLVESGTVALDASSLGPFVTDVHVAKVIHSKASSLSSLSLADTKISDLSLFLMTGSDLPEGIVTCVVCGRLCNSTLDNGCCSDECSDKHETAETDTVSDVTVPDAAAGVDDIAVVQHPVRRKLQLLTLLDLKNCEVTAKGVETLASLPALRELSLQGVAVDDDDLDTLLQLKQIRRLNIAHTYLSAKCICELRALQLEYLDISGTDSTDEVLATFMKHPTLKRIACSETFVTRKQVELAKAKLEVDHDGLFADDDDVVDDKVELEGESKASK